MPRAGAPQGTGPAPATDGRKEGRRVSSGVRSFRHLFDGTVERYDPWDAAYRTTAPQYPGTTMCSALRTFQGWTAISDMPHDQGLLHTVPIPGAMAYLMLQPLLADDPDDDMCGVTVSRAFPASENGTPAAAGPQRHPRRPHRRLGVVVRGGGQLQRGRVLHRQLRPCAGVCRQQTLRSPSDWSCTNRGPTWPKA